jgi:(p)ppGpp synthase/HD superfamily hydrolase
MGQNPTNHSPGRKPLLTSRFRDALSFAASLHEEQVRKGTDIPYVAHLLAVTALVLEHGADEDVAIAALLHDAAEDQGGTDILQQIHKLYGHRVGSVVEACSDTTEFPKPPWKQRKQRYIEHLATVSDDALLVSLADKLHNARAIRRDYRRHGEALWDRFQGAKDGTLWYYSELVATFANLGKFPDLTRELTTVVEELVGLVQSSTVPASEDAPAVAKGEAQTEKG